MSYDDYDEYEYDDEEYYDDDEEYLDYTEDADEDASSRRSRFGGSSGLPGSSSSGSRFGGSSSSSGSRFGGSSGLPGSSSSGSRFGGSSSSSSGSRFGGSSSSSSSGGSRFGSSSSSSFGSSNKDDDKSSSSGSRFGSSSSSGSSGSRFGGTSSSRFGSSSKDDDKSSSSGSRFGSSSSSSSSGSRFGGSSSSSSGSRFGSSSSSSSSKKDDDKKDNKSSSSGSRFGGSRFGSSSSSSSSSKKDDKKSSSGSRFGSSSSSSPKKDDAKKDDKKDESSGGVFGNIRSRLTSGDSSDGDSASPVAGVMSSVSGLFNRGGNKDDKKDDAKKDSKKSSSSSASSSSSSSGSRFGGSRFGSSSSSSSSSKKDDKKDDKSSSSGSRFGGSRFGSSSSSSSKKDDKKDTKSSRQSPLGARRTNKDDKKDTKGNKAASPRAKPDASSGVLGRITSAFSFGSSGDNKDSKSSTTKKASTRKVPKAQTSDGLTLDNWLDIIGVGFVVVSLILFFSGLSNDQAAIGIVHNALGELFGWGDIFVPIAMMVIGVWLIVRHFGEEAPTVDPIRVIGVVMVFVTMLYYFQWIDSFSYAGDIIADDWETARILLRSRLNYSWNTLQSGGGLIGAELYYLTATTVTEFGGFLLMTLIALIGVLFITRMSVAEILRAVAGMSLAVRENMKQRAVQKRAERQLAAREVAAEQARLAAQGVPSQAVVQTANATPMQDASGREIRMTVGGQAQTVSMDGQADAMGQVQPAYGPPMQAMPMQPATANANNGGGFSLFGRGNGNNSGGFSLFGRGNGNNTVAPPPPSSIPANPLPMDDGYSHFDTGPIRVAPPAPEQKPQRLGEMLGQQAPSQQPTPPANPIPPPSTSAQPAAQADASAGTSPEKDEVNDYLKQRQDRLDKLRRGEIGPISQSAMARARQEDVSSAFVPSNEGQREDDFQSQFGTGIGDAVRAESEQVTGDGSTSDFTPPSKLPSVQADGDTSPKQQMLSVPVEKPKSSKIQSNRVKVNWNLPDYRTLLSSGSEQEFDREYLLKQAHTIEETLEAFGAPGRVVEVNTGPVITQFGVEPDYVSGRGGRKQRVKVSAIAGLDKDLQLALGARSIRVEAPVPGKGYVGVEVPNAESTLVSLRDVMDSPGFSKHKTPLAIALGQSVSGAPISADLSSMPHLLIAGTTGSGKSVCVNSIIASIISRNTPEQVKFIMVDPKRVELTGYNGIPHLVAPVVVELERIVGVLKWVTREMDARYKQFSEAGSRNIEDFNRNRDPNSTDQMPYLVVIIDELADLMMLAPEETERTITRIAALARATGIHLVIATQRPSVDVVTGLIKANFPARIAFAVAGSVDSRVILDQPGAERLLGKGDMLYLSGDSPAPLRLQGVYVSDMEINNIVRYWKMQGLKQSTGSQAGSLSSSFNVEQAKPVQARSTSNDGGAFWDNGNSGDDDLPLFAAAKRSTDSAGDSADVELTKRELTGDVKEGNEDELYDKAVELVRRLDKASISLLQRRLRIGYTRAARLIDVMEARGVVGPSKDGSSKPRDVLPE